MTDESCRQVIGRLGGLTLTKLQMKIYKAKQYRLKMMCIRHFEKPQYAREQQMRRAVIMMMGGLRKSLDWEPERNYNKLNGDMRMRR